MPTSIRVSIAYSSGSSRIRPSSSWAASAARCATRKGRRRRRHRRDRGPAASAPLSGPGQDRTATGGRRPATIGCRWTRQAPGRRALAARRPLTMADAKRAARERVERARDELVALSHRIHAHPELGFEEERACAWLCELLAGAGLEVERGVGGLPTAFAARAGAGPLRVVVCAEYDALPGVGHACGHNVIAAMAAGAGMALAEVADDVGLEVTVLGTPAEEGGGGKILLLRQGAFAGAHAAMMVHPSPYEIAEMPAIAVTQLRVAYTGKEAHASAYPQLGVNAADALVVAQTAIGLLRQHLLPGDRVHGIVTHGGDAPNVIPAHTAGTWMVRA